MFCPLCRRDPTEKKEMIEGFSFKVASKVCIEFRNIVLRVTIRRIGCVKRRQVPQLAFRMLWPPLCLAFNTMRIRVMRVGSHGALIKELVFMQLKSPQPCSLKQNLQFQVCFVLV